MDEQIILKPIGIIHSPYKEKSGMPIQGRFKKDVKAETEIYPQHKEGLKGIEGFSHLIFIYHFHKSDSESLSGMPFLEDNTHGIFAIRSPNRPNKIGMSVVKLEKVKGNIITFSGVDMFDKTPLLDIKPYISYFDARENVKNGWLNKHFKEGKIPDRTKIK